MNNNNFKISFCTTCKGRLYQLKQTIFDNIYEIKKDINSNLILLNYNDNNGLDDFIKNNLQEEINNNVLIYLRETSAELFNFSKAKNLAHFAADGDYLMNLDGDNFLNKSVPSYRKVWEQYPRTLIHGRIGGRKSDGTFGRIGLSRQLFQQVGGYDEDLFAYSEDIDLLKRINSLDIMYASVTDASRLPVQNTVDDTLILTTEKGMSEDDLHKVGMKISKSKLAGGGITRNINRKKIKLIKNFKEEIYV